MTNTMTKEQLIAKVGKNSFLDDDITLAAKLNYNSGILIFDEYLDGKTLKQIGAVIHLTKHPKGLAIKIAKNFSSFPFGLAFDEIKKTVVSETASISHLIFDTTFGKIIFSLKSKDAFEIKQYLNDIYLKYDIVSSKVYDQNTKNGSSNNQFVSDENVKTQTIENKVVNKKFRTKKKPLRKGQS